MTGRRHVLTGASALGLTAWLAAGCAAPRASGVLPVVRSDAEWRKALTADQYAVLRLRGTETPGFSPLLHEARSGLYACVGCGQPAFSSEAKYDSHTGWPSFWQPVAGAVTTAEDRSQPEIRTEVACATCGGHLGHLFKDGPRPTGLRYCMNGTVLSFRPGTA